MNSTVTLNQVSIRTFLQPGDMGYITYLHGILYSQEYQYGLSFENYVAAGLREFYLNYDPDKDGVWICEHHKEIVGFLLLVHREDRVAQLRYFILKASYRGIGLGKKLMDLFIQFLKEKKYRSTYLWTTHEQEAAASLYKKYGFLLCEEKQSTAFGKLLKEQRYELVLDRLDS